VSPDRRIADARDPGAAWADSVLRPIRRLEADVDVAPAVLARVRAEQPGFEAIPLPGRPPRAVWTVAIAAGVGAVAILGTAAVAMVLGGDSGIRILIEGIASLGRGLLVVGEAALAIAGRLLGTGLIAAARLLTGAHDAAPYVRRVGTVAATLGAVSILVSLHGFASARRLAAQANHNGGAR
jgi:hypothetical protein